MVELYLRVAITLALAHARSFLLSCWQRIAFSSFSFSAYTAVSLGPCEALPTQADYFSRGYFRKQRFGKESKTVDVGIRVHVPFRRTRAREEKARPLDSAADSATCKGETAITARSFVRSPIICQVGCDWTAPLKVRQAPLSSEGSCEESLHRGRSCHCFSLCLLGPLRC